MKVKMIKILSTLSTFLLVILQVNAQVDTTKNTTIPELPGDEVEVIKDFQARLAEAQMLRLIPQSPVVQTSVLTYDYNVELRKLELDYLPPTIRPVALPSPEEIPMYNSLLSFGYGYPRLSEGFAFADYAINNRLNLGLRYKHLASSHRDKLPSGFYRNDGQIYGSYGFGNGLEARAEIDLAFDKNEILERNGDFRNNRYDNTYGVEVGFGKGFNSDGKFHYDASLNFSRFNVNDLVLTSFRENTIRFKASSTYVEEYWRAGLEATLLNTSSNVDSLNGYGAFLLDPYGVYAIDAFKLKLGASLVVDDETKIYPQVEGSYKIMGDLLVVRAFAQTRFNQNNHQNTYEYNPFIRELSTYGIEREMQFGGGIEGRNEKWSYRADVYYSLYKDIQSYSLDSLGADYVYDVEMIDGNAVNVRAFGSYKVAKNVGLETSIMYRNLRDTLGVDIAGYYDLEWQLGSTISLLGDKLQLKPGLSVLLFNPLFSEESNASFIDLQFEADYAVSKKVRLFVKGFNLLNSSNARWEGYDALGVSGLGGVRVKF